MNHDNNPNACDNSMAPGGIYNCVYDNDSGYCDAPCMSHDNNPNECDFAYVPGGNGSYCVYDSNTGLCDPPNMSYNQGTRTSRNYYIDHDYDVVVLGAGGAG